MKIIIINGPNLNLLGKREPEIYGSQTLKNTLSLANKIYGLRINLFQSNIELIDKIQNLVLGTMALFSMPVRIHTSIGIGDAVKPLQLLLLCTFRTPTPAKGRRTKNA
jgi:3-dehydroquinate dehydratase-2